MEFLGSKSREQEVTLGPGAFSVMSELAWGELSRSTTVLASEIKDFCVEKTAGRPDSRSTVWSSLLERASDSTS